ncbi:MAG: hypothetical protein K9H25_14435 [Rhodospirillum sp.]|nr:hypothetical protein [Rhodospirillum sp.]MCF8491743.1 hypothetical protein [Rhodospirillum sp.]MCF8501720.1 hypothetical protein [Rhodospirillum sp.]
MAGTPLFELLILATCLGLMGYTTARAAKAAQKAREAARVRVRATNRRR